MRRSEEYVRESEREREKEQEGARARERERARGRKEQESGGRKVTKGAKSECVSTGLYGRFKREKNNNDVNADGFLTIPNPAEKQKRIHYTCRKIEFAYSRK